MGCFAVGNLRLYVQGTLNSSRIPQVGKSATQCGNFRSFNERVSVFFLMERCLLKSVTKVIYWNGNSIHKKRSLLLSLKFEERRITVSDQDQQYQLKYGWTRTSTTLTKPFQKDAVCQLCRPTLHYNWLPLLSSYRPTVIYRVQSLGNVPCPRIDRPMLCNEKQCVCALFSILCDLLCVNMSVS